MKTITDLRQIQPLIDQFEMDPNLRKEGKLSLDGKSNSILRLFFFIFGKGFRSLLLSEEFDLADPYAMKNIYQDMTRSFSFICTDVHRITSILDLCAIIISVHLITRERSIGASFSLNRSRSFSYLFYSQLTGDSNPEAYNRVLFSGGRAVELDCYDGDDGQPIVYHAYTLVKPCTFESIIRAIDKNLFKTSP